MPIESQQSVDVNGMRVNLQLTTIYNRRNTVGGPGEIRSDLKIVPAIREAI